MKDGKTALLTQIETLQRRLKASQQTVERYWSLICQKNERIEALENELADWKTNSLN